MHYLEDYLELLEPLREIMREKFTLMRENDLKLQAEFTQLEEDSLEFLNNYRLYQKQSLLSPTKSKIDIYNLTSSSSVNDQSLELTSEQLSSQQQKQIEYNKLIERHKQIIEMTTIKTILADESHDCVERYYKKLENDLQKFKMELEADYSGLTEILEKRFANESCNEYGDKTNENTFDLSLFDIEPLFDSYDDLTMSNSLTDDYANQSTLSYLTAQSHRLTPCMFNRKQHQRLHSSLRGRKRLQDTNNISKRKGNIIRNSLLNDTYSLNPSDSDESSTNNYFNLNNSISLSNLFDNETNILGNFSGTIDERRYCFCNEMSYGDMIACDNPNCRREWFHYSCVGIITPPKGKWFCTDCSQIVQQKLQISTIKRA